MENLPTPLSRVELYLAKACGMDVTVPEQPLSRLEQFLAIIAGDTSVPMPTPMSLTEQWLAYVLGVTPDPLLAVEGACLIGAQKVDARYFAVAASMPGATLPDAPQNRAEMYWAHIAVNPPTPGILKYVTGTSIHLTDVVSGIEELQYVKGDTFQQTYSGKNLFSGDYAQFDNTGGTGNVYNYFALPEAGKYTITLIAKNDITPSDSHYFGFMDNGGTSGGKYRWVFNNITSSIAKGTKYSGNNTVSGTDLGFVSMYPKTEEVFDWFVDNFEIQLEAGSTSTDYEPYVGGIPAPSPSYPMLISVVTGEQTVTISDGVDSRAFPISLGSIELCNIGDYQDKIFNNDPSKDWYDPDLEDNAWYVHKNVGKLILKGGSGEYWSKLNLAFQTTATADKGPHVNTGYSDNFSFYPAQTAITSNIGDRQFGWNTSKQLTIRYDACQDSTAFNTWLQSHNTSVYYNLASPTDTKITDATLVGQLEAINSAVLPKPVANIIVSATGTNLEATLTIAYYGSDE